MRDRGQLGTGQSRIEWIAGFLFSFVNVFVTSKIYESVGREVKPLYCISKCYTT